MTGADGDHGITGGDDDSGTGLPGLRSWPAVYLFVLGVFVLWIVALTVLTRSLS
jgi:hypothetical protein